MPRRMGVPPSPDDLTTAWLEQELRRSGTLPGGTVAGLDWRIIGEEFGFTGVVARLYPTYDDLSPNAKVPPSIIAKFPTAERAVPSAYLTTQQRDAVAARRHYERCVRELRFYREIAPTSPIPVPHLYGGVADETGHVVILLEDVPDATAGDVLPGCSPAEAALVLDAMARFHARWWATDDFPWLPGWPSGHQARQERLNEQITPFLDRFGDRLPPALHEVVVRLGMRYTDVVAVLDEAPLTILHADLHLDNILFLHADGAPGVMIVDWQSVCRRPAAVEVAFFLYGSLDPADRRAAEADLLHRYHTELIGHGVRDYSLANLGDDCRRALLHQLAGVVGWLAGADFEQLTGRERALAEAALGDGRLVSALIDHDVASLLPR